MIRSLVKIFGVVFAAIGAVIFGLGAIVGGVVRSLFGTHAADSAEVPGAIPFTPPEKAAAPKRRGQVVRTLLAAGVVLAILGGLAAVSGLIPVKASSGHWAITEWFLHFTMRRSVATRSLGEKPPTPLSDPDLILKGATHYEIGCRSCHGAPGLRLPRIPQAMTPHPPALPERVRELKDRELFYVVKHGVKFTGMPAWPAQKRDDEVWAVVAFLKQLPGMSAEKYRGLVDGAPAPTAGIETLGIAPEIEQAVTQTCARCHGHDGLARGTGAFPHLAGQRREYLENTLLAYAKGERHSGIMEPIAAGLDDATIRKLAAHYSSLPGPNAGSSGAPDPAAIERGRLIAERGVPEKRIPSCLECHGPEGKSAYPLLAGQPAEYLVQQLALFEEGARGGTAYAHLMEPVIQWLKPEQMRDVARYFESLAPGPSGANQPPREGERR